MDGWISVMTESDGRLLHVAMLEDNHCDGETGDEEGEKGRKSKDKGKGRELKENDSKELNQKHHQPLIRVEGRENES